MSNVDERGICPHCGRPAKGPHVRDLGFYAVAAFVVGVTGAWLWYVFGGPDAETAAEHAVAAAAALMAAAVAFLWISSRHA